MAVDNVYHQGVMIAEAIEGLNIKQDGIYVDVTFGAGGHSKAILEKLKGGQLIAFDQDKESLVNAINDERFLLIEHNFRFIKSFLKYYNMLPIDGLIADLGVSSHQFDSEQRGFSIRFDNAPLDMRMNQAMQISAKDVINTYEEEKLANIFYFYGELNQARAMAAKIIEERQNKMIDTVGQLKQCLQHFAPKFKAHKFYAQVFQSIRIEVNQELTALEELLQQSVDILKPGGRLVIIAYHSLEDRLVKNMMKTGNLKGEVQKDFFGKQQTPFKLITRKPMEPSQEEITNNNRARSAKLRIAEKL